MKKLVKVIGLGALGLTLNSVALASGSDYSLGEWECQNDQFYPSGNGLEVCRNVTWVLDSLSRIKMTYKGALLRGFRPQLSIFMKLNGKMTRRGYEVGAIAMNCSPTYSRDEPGGVVHYCSFEADSNSYNNPMSYIFTDANRKNAWDVEVAIVDSEGHWDSRNGENYKFHFDAHLN